MARLTSSLKGVAALVAVALFVAPALAEEPKLESLDTALQKAAPKILAELNKREFKNVGVLKFLVADNDGKLRDNVGPINRTLADRLEVALTLALDEKTPIGIVVGASDGIVASGNARANHQTPRGRKELFSIGQDSDTKYFRVPWKANEKIQPDAFLTGEAIIGKDRRSLAVKIQLVTKDKLEPLCDFTAANDTRTLTETGLTFATKRGADFKEAVAMVDESAPTANDKGDDLKKKADAALALLNTSPVKLEIIYKDKINGREAIQDVTADAGDKYNSNVLLRVPSPTQNTDVSFRLTNQTKTGDTFGAVLRLNGRNTIYEQRQDPAASYKWILKPGESVTVSGFQVNDKERVPFKVLTPSQSELESINYGDNAGTFDLVLFRAVAKPAPVIVQSTPEQKEQEASVAAIARGAMVLKGEPPATDLKSFKAQLKHEGAEKIAAGRTGGLIVPGMGVDKNPVKQVEFYPSSVPVLSTTIRYYSLKN